MIPVFELISNFFAIFNWMVVLPLVAVFLLLKLIGARLLTWAAACWIGSFVLFKYGFAQPVPMSVVKIYMGIVSLGLLAYVTSSRERMRQIGGPILRFIVQPRYTIPLIVFALAIPALVAGTIYINMNRPAEAPIFGRTVHPAPPTEITVHDKTIDLVTADNPYRHLEKDDPQEFARRVERGRELYYANCFYCHGDLMAGKGMFAHALNPIPTNFTDQTLEILQESFVFWRIAKGGPGLPDEGGPWDSAMPAWEDFLTEEEMWEVVLFLYDFTELRPRAREEGHH